MKTMVTNSKPPRGRWYLSVASWRGRSDLAVLLLLFLLPIEP